MIRALRHVLAATLLGVAAGAASIAPAHAAACSGASGVTVVVGSSVRCDADGGGRAAQNFADAGHKLTYASRAAGFVCRVDGAPASDPCVEASPADAYWALFWSDGTSGQWSYATLGVSSLKIPQGGSVAFVFQGSSSRTWPSVAAPVVSRQAAPAPAPTRAPGAGSSSSAGGGPAARPRMPGAPAASAPRAGGGGAGATGPTATVPSASASASASASTSPGTRATSAPTVGTDTSAADPVEQVTPLASTGDADTSTAAWVVGAGVLALLAGAAVVVVRRRGRV